MSSRDKNGSLLLPPVEVFGVSVYLVKTNEGPAITKRDAQRVLKAPTGLGLQPRQARAAISSYRAEGWDLPGAGRLDAPLFAVNSFENRVLEHRDQRSDSRAKNGRLGGRPRKPAWDVSGTSGW